MPVLWQRILYNKCEECGATKNIEAHHKIPLIRICFHHNYDYDAIKNSKIFNDVTNGQALCRKCHNKKHKTIQERIKESEPLGVNLEGKTL